MKVAVRILVIAVGSAWAAFGPVSRADPPPTPLPSWKEGDEWYLNVTSYPRGDLNAGDPLERGKPAPGEPIHFDLRVRVAGSEVAGGALCWQVDFLPVKAPPPIGGPVRVWVGKGDGLTRRVLLDGAATDFGPSAGVPMLAVPPPGIPLELFPRIDRPVNPVWNGPDVLSLQQYARGETFNADAVLCFMGRTRIINKVVVHQTWSPKEGWWSSYERFLYGAKDVEARVGIPPAPETPPAKSTGEAPPTPPPDPLASDPRLQKKLDINMHGKRLRELLDFIESQVPVKLSLEPRLEQQNPTFGTYYTASAPAYRVLGDIASHSLVDGRWEKTEGGYRLYGVWRTAHASSPPAPQGGWSDAFRWWLTGGSIVGIAAVAGWFVYRRPRKPVVAKAPQQRPQEAAR